ncbi:alpha/beta hydrolase [Paenibacillus sp. P26]|nr:alpha/beta hydrolase [Paenibacillus sp. P26]
MRLVPGGGSHWLPLVHVDHAAEFISALACETQPDSATYFLMDERENSPTMLELGKHMAKELRVARPVGSIPPAFLSKVLDTPMGRKLGIPKESLDFIVNEEYPLSAAQKIRNRHGLSHKVKPDILPFIFADLDFRIVHPHVQPAGYIRGKRGPLASLERKGTDPGKRPIVFVHGLLSGADGLLPLAGQFPEADVCLVDLPGLGRSPYHHHPDVLEGHIEALVRAIRAFDTPVTLIGHSLGGSLAAKAWERVPECIGRLHLLQPVLHAAPMKYRSARLTEAALRRLTASGLQKRLLSQTCFESAGEIPPTYIPYVLEELRSPRVRKTTAEAFSTLTKTESFRVSPRSAVKARGSNPLGYAGPGVPVAGALSFFLRRHAARGAPLSALASPADGEPPEATVRNAERSGAKKWVELCPHHVSISGIVCTKVVMINGLDPDRLDALYHVGRFRADDPRFSHRLSSILLERHFRYILFKLFEGYSVLCPAAQRHFIHGLHRSYRLDSLESLFHRGISVALKYILDIVKKFRKPASSS